MKTLINKYNQSAPRYTSYPPVPFWQGPPSEEVWLGHIKTQYTNKGVDLYVHVPFCEKLCYYCGCNRTITKNHSVEEVFISLILKEWNIYKEKLGFTPIVNTLHFGGGTPTFLSPENLDTLIEELTTNKSDEFIGSIEIDPRTVLSGHIKVFKKHNISRVSIGIQDFDHEVQVAINRLQSFDLVKNVVDLLRLNGIQSINFDVIYGLPKQTKDSISHTFKLIKLLRPDLIAYYSYAHLPERIKNQKLIREEFLPTGEEKQLLYEIGKEILKSDGYLDVGMDHFGLEDSYLVRAKKENKLHRNFMGYLDAKSNILIGLGPTSISDSGESFVQNEKSYTLYEEKISKGEIPIHIGHIMNEEDKVIQKNILEIMCMDKTLLNLEKISSCKDVLNEFREMEKDELIHFENNQIEVTQNGKKFVRNIAMVLDYHLRNKKSEIKFSQSI